MSDPVAAVRDIYRHFGEELQPLHVRRIQAWMSQRGRDVFGRHGYAAGDFGLAAEDLEERYASYRSRYSVPVELSD